MLTFIINLEKDTERRNYITEHFHSFGINDFILVKAIDGYALSKKQISTIYNIKRNKKYVSDPLTRGEIGCALSHLRCYEKLVNTNKPGAFIFEDDCKLNAHTLEVMQAIEKTTLPNNALISLGFITLYEKKVSVKLTGIYSLHRVAASKRSINFLAHAYYITRQAALNFLRAFRKVYIPIDYWDFHINKKHIKMHMVLPFCASVDQKLSEKSHIEEHRKLFTNRIAKISVTYRIKEIIYTMLPAPVKKPIAKFIHLLLNQKKQVTYKQKKQEINF